jgi:hypothetical protein
MVAMPNCAEGGLCASLPLVSISGMATTTKTPWARKFDTGGRVRQTPAERLADTHTKAEGQRVAKATTVTALNSRAALGVAPPSNMISYVMPPNAIDATSSTGTAQSPIQRRSRAPAAWHAAAGLQGATSQRRCRCSWWRRTWRHPLGALAGGAYGYWAANKAIEGGRNAAGVDPRAPVDQLAAPPAAPIVGGGNGQRMTTAQDPRAITPTMAAPVAPSAPVAPVANQGAALPLNQPNGEVTRVGNSYRATQSSDQFQSAATARKASAPTCISRSRWPARYGPSRRHSVDRLAARSGHSFIALSDDFSDLTKVRNCHRRSSAVLQSIGCYYGLTLGGPWPG